MSEKPCPAGCGNVYGNHKVNSPCPHFVAWRHETEKTPAHSMPNYAECLKYADEHWREFWHPMVGDWVHTLDTKRTFLVSSLGDAHHRQVILFSNGFARHADDCRPATPLEIKAASPVLLGEDAVDVAVKIDIAESTRRVKNIVRIRELIGCSLATAKRLVDGFRMELGAKYLTRGGKVARSSAKFNLVTHQSELLLAHEANGERLGDGRWREQDLLCRIYECAGKYFVETGEERTPERNEWFLCGLILKNNAVLTVKYVPILLEVSLPAAGPASATPEARHDPAPQPAASGAAAASVSDTQQNDSSDRAVTPVAPAAAPVILLPDWTDGDVQAYLVEVEKYCGKEFGYAIAAFWEGNPDDMMDDRKRAFVVRAWLIGHYHYETDPRKCGDIRHKRLCAEICRAGEIAANRYQKTFDLTAWTRGAV